MASIYAEMVPPDTLLIVQKMHLCPSLYHIPHSSHKRPAHKANTEQTITTPAPRQSKQSTEQLTIMKTAPRHSIRSENMVSYFPENSESSARSLKLPMSMEQMSIMFQYITDIRKTSNGEVPLTSPFSSLQQTPSPLSFFKPKYFYYRTARWKYLSSFKL